MDANTGVAANAYTDCLHAYGCQQWPGSQFLHVTSKPHTMHYSITYKYNNINQSSTCNAWKPISTGCHYVYGSQSALAATMNMQFMEANQHWLPVWLQHEYIWIPFSTFPTLFFSAWIEDSSIVMFGIQTCRPPLPISLATWTTCNFLLLWLQL